MSIEIVIPDASEVWDFWVFDSKSYISYLIKEDGRFVRKAVWDVEAGRDLEVPGAVDVWVLWRFDGCLYASYTDRPVDHPERRFGVHNITRGEGVDVPGALTVNFLWVIGNRLFALYTVFREPRYDFDRIYDVVNRVDLDVPNTDHIWELVEHRGKLYLCCEEGVWCVEDGAFVQLGEAKDWWGLTSRGDDLLVTLRTQDGDRLFNITQQRFEEGLEEKLEGEPGVFRAGGRALTVVSGEDGVEKILLE